jgi:hypothetical protein
MEIKQAEAEGEEEGEGEEDVTGVTSNKSIYATDSGIRQGIIHPRHSLLLCYYYRFVFFDLTYDLCQYFWHFLCRFHFPFVSINICILSLSTLCKLSSPFMVLFFCVFIIINFIFAFFIIISLIFHISWFVAFRLQSPNEFGKAFSGSLMGLSRERLI